MKKAVAMVALGAAALTLAPAQAHSRSVEATILLTTGATGLNGPAGCPSGAPGCYKTQVARHVRCLYLQDPALNQQEATGRFGYVVELTGAEGDGEHSFTLADATGAAAKMDFDITFYSNLGSCAGEPVGSNPEPNPSEPNVHSFGRLGDDKGAIAKGMKYAIVTLFGGVNAKFKLTIKE